jgi:hypothetical protein
MITFGSCRSSSRSAHRDRQPHRLAHLDLVDPPQVELHGVLGGHDVRLAPVERREGRVEVAHRVALPDADPDAPALRPPPLGDVEVRQDLDARGHVVAHAERQAAELGQHPVDAEADRDLVVLVRDGAAAPMRRQLEGRECHGSCSSPRRAPRRERSLGPSASGERSVPCATLFLVGRESTSGSRQAGSARSRCTRLWTGGCTVPPRIFIKTPPFWQDAVLLLEGVE